MMGELTKSSSLLRLVLTSFGDAFFVSGEADDDPVYALQMSEDRWTELGKPEEITMTIEPGDKLNETG